MIEIQVIVGHVKFIDLVIDLIQKNKKIKIINFFFEFSFNIIIRLRFIALNLYIIKAAFISYIFNNYIFLTY